MKRTQIIQQPRDSPFAKHQANTNEYFQNSPESFRQEA